MKQYIIFFTYSKFTHRSVQIIVAAYNKVVDPE